MRKMTMLAAVAAALLFVGCGEKEKTCFFVSQDGKALREGACVIWKDACDASAGAKAYVGRVGALEETGRGVKVTISFDAKHRDDVHDGVAARIVNNPKFSPNAFVLLTGGKDAVKPTVEDGSEIPEARDGNIIEKGFSAFLDWLHDTHADELKWYAVVLIALVVLIKFVSKMLKFVFTLLFVVIICYFCMSASAGWSGYQEKLESAVSAAQDATTWLLEHGEDLKNVLKTVAGK